MLISGYKPLVSNRLLYYNWIINECGLTHMSLCKNYDEKLKIIRAIPDKRIKTAKDIPLSTFIQEANNLCTWCRKDKEVLLKAGLESRYFSELPDRIDTLREAHSQYRAIIKEKNNTKSKLKEKKQRLLNVRSSLIKAYHYAFRHHKGILNQIAFINKKIDYKTGNKNRSSEPDIKKDSNNLKKTFRKRTRTTAAYIQNLNDLRLIGEQQIDLLKKINFDQSLLDEADALIREVSQLSGKIKTDKVFDNKQKELKKIRNQAYSWLKEAVDEIRTCGRFVFRRTDERYIGYISHYVKNKMKKQNKKKPDTA